MGQRGLEAGLASFALAVGTAWLPFSTLLYGRVTSGALAFAAGYLLFFGFRGSSRWPVWTLAGLLAGLAVLVEFPTGLAVVILGLYGLWRYRHDAARFALSFGAGTAFSLLPLPLYNVVSFGNPLTLGYMHVDDPAFAGMRSGLLGTTLPRLEALHEILLGSAGLFVQSPYLLLALLGFALCLRQSRWRAEGITSLAVFLAFLAYNSGYYLPMGGQSSGPRFLVPSLPFLALGLAFVPRSLLWVGLPALGYSALQMLAITFSFPKTGPGHANAFFDYWLPRFLAGDLVETPGSLRFGLEGTASLLPLLALVLAAALSLAIWWLAVRTSDGRPRLALVLAGISLVLNLIIGGIIASPIDPRHPSQAPPEMAQLAPAVGPKELIGVRYGDDFELVGYTLGRDNIEPGGWVRLDLFWRTTARPTERYVVYVHAFARDAEGGALSRKVGGFDAVPGAGTYPPRCGPSTRSSVTAIG